MKKNIVCAAFISLLFLCQPLCAQWLKEKGKGYYKLSSWYLLADEHFTDTGKLDPNATRGIFISSLFVKHGLSDKINLIAYIPFFVRNLQYKQLSFATGQTLQEGEAFNGFGDANLSVEIKLKAPTRWAFSAALVLGLPTGNNSAGSDGSYQTGDGEFNQKLQFNAGSGYKLGSLSCYFKTFVGYNNRTKGFSDELHLGAESGTQLFNKKLLLLLRSRWINPLKNGSLDATNSNGTIFANNIETLTFGAETALSIYKNLGISFSYAIPLRGRLIYKAPSFSGGIYLNI